MKKIVLEPVDKDRCQAEYREGSFMTFGPRSLKRCKNKPVWIAKANAPFEDGQYGAMSLCMSCADIMEKKHGKDFASLIGIESENY